MDSHEWRKVGYWSHTQVGDGRLTSKTGGRRELEFPDTPQVLMSWHRSVTRSILFLWSFVFSSITSTEQESRHVDDHGRPPSYSMTTVIGNAESYHRTLPDCVPTVPQEAPPSYAYVCESEGWV